MSFILLEICALGSRFLVIITSFLQGWQQILASEARLLPLRLVGFMGLVAEAAESCFYGAVAAFNLGKFHGTQDKGS